MRCINNEPSSVLKIVEFAEMGTQKEFGFSILKSAVFRNLETEKLKVRLRLGADNRGR